LFQYFAPLNPLPKTAGSKEQTWPAEGGFVPDPALLGFLDFELLTGVPPNVTSIIRAYCKIQFRHWAVNSPAVLLNISLMLLELHIGHGLPKLLLSVPAS